MVLSSAGMGLAAAAFPLDSLPLGGRPVQDAIALFALILISCLALEWTWRTAWSLADSPSPIKEPSTSLRWTILLILISVLFRLIPDTIEAMAWEDAGPELRAALALWNERFNSLSSFPFALAWLLAYLGGPMILHQLRRTPIPLHLWPTGRQMARPAKIAGACLALALALTYLR